MKFDIELDERLILNGQIQQAHASTMSLADVPEI